MPNLIPQPVMLRMPCNTRKHPQKAPFNGRIPLSTSMTPARRVSLTRATLEERLDRLQTLRHPWKPPSHLLLRCYLLKISTNMLLGSRILIRLFPVPLGRCLRANHKPLRCPLIRVSHSLFLTTFSLTADTMTLFVSSIAHPAAMFNEKGGESQAQRGLFPAESQHALKQPAATGPVTAQPAPRELYHPLAREDRQGEGLGVQPTSLDIQNSNLQTQWPENRSSFWRCC